MFKDSIFSSLLVGLWLLMSLSSSVTSATTQESKSSTRQVECGTSWSTIDTYKNPLYVSCGDEKGINTCDDTTCHMGGPKGNADSNPMNHELFFDQCAKIDHQGKELTKPIYRIFPRTYKVSERDNIMVAYGFAPSESSYAPSFFKCRYDQASGLNVRRVWCDSCFPKQAHQ
ncbi:hypothetical protein PGTUg99_025008 [Puccinia graminis f. sp. tritici]|uniref:Secreted protein n=2 Tax=Puccinia graminis f. sp. tritici TaxID=56615 RepID=E3L8M1_PUCGT|nr:uncharacterized protein PGTG_18814 [Puccinia graminis f. sp. tritici CRL 75-36-700-3]EFP92896.2 hypothetical protein PGTG_18814 [Puccinia graminis f. sp. tritici CRL 75-36-700-3]KAA1125597.1 hypothetical protein PGTUg99_007022 [Puccinia graminis f. sp. tritici]KAA1133847.1 hypothetical protein PGTUg99_025008 [Puccinia graminis f. sp. tritici]